MRNWIAHGATSTAAVPTSPTLRGDPPRLRAAASEIAIVAATSAACPSITSGSPPAAASA